MKTLLVVRHAKSSWKNTDIADHKRKLNKRGKHDAPMMAKRIKRTGIHPDIIYSSHAYRAHKTAEVIAEELNYSTDKIKVENIIYEGETQDIINLIKNIPDNARVAMLIGHNPTITNLVNKLTHHNIENVPTTGVACLTFKTDSWSEADEASLEWFDYPKNKPKPKEFIM